MQTHEAYIGAVAALAMARLDVERRAAFAGVKLVYGSGMDGTRGVTYFNQWRNGADAAPFVELSAFGEEDWLQLAGTTLHELGHVLAGSGHGHDTAWRDACESLGLRRAKAAGMVYRLASLAPDLRHAIAALDKPTDGQPIVSLRGGDGKPLRTRPCGAGIGTRGGKSRGVGSGSRLRLFVCECDPPVKVRAARDVLAAHCDLCSGAFARG